MEGDRRGGEIERSSWPIKGQRSIGIGQLSLPQYTCTCACLECDSFPGMYVMEVREGNCDGHATPSVVRETPATAFVDGKNGIGTVGA